MSNTKPSKANENTGTDAGKDAGKTAAAARIAPVIAGTMKLEMPTRTSNRGSSTAYPFGDLEVGAAFGVKNKNAKQMASIVSNQNRKAENKRPKVDEAGNKIFKTQELTGADGTVTRVPTGEAEMEQIKNFFAIDVTKEYAEKLKGTPLEGSTVLVFRDK